MAASSCGEPPADRGPIVLVTVAGLRADALESSRTPRLDEFAATAHWSGTVIAASSQPPAALASLMTGVSPWQHQMLSAERPIRRRFPTLAQALADAGYSTRAYIPSSLHALLGAGFDRIEDDVSGPDAVDAVANLSGSELVWLHLNEVEIGRGPARRDLDEALPTRRRLLSYADPQKELPEDLRHDLWHAYRRRVERLDHLLGELIDSLRQSPSWDRTTVIVTAPYGCELGEHGGIFSGENLGREAIEVPLFFRGPRDLGRPIEPGVGRPAQIRLWTTISESAGAATAPVHFPSLLAPSRAPVLSELYRRNGVNRFSLVDGDLQLHWTTRFAAAEPEYYPALRVLAGGRARRLGERPQRIFRRLDRAFERTPPLSGPAGSEPELALERWLAGGVERLDDPATAGALATRLRERWMRFVDQERPPGEERAFRVAQASGGLF